MFFDISIDLKNSVAILIPLGEGEPQPINFERLNTEHPLDYQFFDAEDNPVRMVPRTSVRQLNFQTLLPEPLPEYSMEETPWYTVLGVNSKDSDEVIEKTFRQLCMINLPKRGGNKERYAEILKAYQVWESLKKK